VDDQQQFHHFDWRKLLWMMDDVALMDGWWAWGISSMRAAEPHA